MNDQEAYRLIARELSSNTTEPGTWTQAFAEAGGSPEKTKANYIQLRFAALKAEAAGAAAQTAAAQVAPDAGLSPALEAAPSRELLQLRRELADMLSASGKASFYSFFGLSPTVGDVDVAAAIARHETRIKEGLTSETPEFRYARDALRHPVERERYDRRLIENLSSIEARRVRGGELAVETAGVGGFMSWWGSGKTSVLVGVVAIMALGYLTLGFVKTKGSQEVATGELSIKRDSTLTHGEIEREKVQNQRLAIEGTLSTADKAIDRAAELQNRELGIRERAEDRHRQEMEYQAAAREREFQLRQEELARRQVVNQQRAEDARVAREQQYWACMKLMSNRVSGHCEQYRR